MIKRILSLLLAVCLLIALAPAAYALDELKPVRILAWQEDYRTLDVYQSSDELLMRAEDLCWLTNYTYTEQGAVFSFTRGSKTVKVDTGSNLIYMAGSQYGWELDNHCHKIDSEWYLPAAGILPWLNTHCEVKDSILVAVPNAVSLWDVIDTFALTDYAFSLEDLMTQTSITLRGNKASIVVSEGLGAIYYLAGDSQNSNMGEELDYYDLFSDMIQDVSATDQSAKTWLSRYDKVEKAIGFVGTGVSFLDETVGKGFDTKGMVYSKEALTLLTYVCSFSQDGANKVKVLQSLVDGADASSNSGMVSAALDVIDNYTDFWTGVYNTVTHQVINNLPDEATSGTILGMLGYTYNVDTSAATQVKRIPLYNNIMAEALDGYRCYTGETELRHLENYVNYIILYLYGVEQNYRAMASYIFSQNMSREFAYYLEKAVETEKVMAEFLNISLLLEDDCSDIDLKQERTAELKELFKKVDPDIVPYGVTAVAENAIYWAAMEDMDVPFCNWDMADLDLDGQQELLVLCDDSEMQWPCYLVIDPNDMTMGSCLSESFFQYLYLRKDSSGRYYIQKDNEEGVITDTLAWAGNAFAAGQSDTLQAAQLPSVDMTELVVAGNTGKMLKQLKKYFKNTRSSACKEADFNGDGIDDLVTCLWKAADFWTERCAEAGYSGCNALCYEDRRITVLVAESHPDGVKLRLTRMDNPGYADDFTVDPQNRTVTVNDTVYAYRETGKPVVIQGNSYGICAADLLGMHVDQIRPQVYDFHMDSSGAATGWYQGDTFLEMTFSGNGVLEKLVVYAWNGQRVPLIDTVCTGDTLRYMLDNTPSISDITEFAPVGLYYETSGSYRDAQGESHIFTAAFDGTTMDSVLVYAIFE